jgi:hypothetical protein
MMLIQDLVTVRKTIMILKSLELRGLEIIFWKKMVGIVGAFLYFCGQVNATEMLNTVATV